MRAFADLAGDPDPPLDELSLALAAEFRDVDAAGALQRLDHLGIQLRSLVTRLQPDPAVQARACASLLGGRHGFAGDRNEYDDPANSMLDLVLQRRRGLPILISVVYVEVARRAGIPVRGVGLPGHFVVGHFGTVPPVLLDPFSGGIELDSPAVPVVRPWSTHDIVMRMLNNLVAAYERRGNLAAALRAAEMRVLLPATGGARETLETELRGLRARLN